MKTLTWIRSALIAVTAVASLALSGCTATSEPATATVGLTFIPNIQFAPFYIADKNDFYSDNVTVTLRHHGSGEGLFTAIAAGEEDFVVAGGDEILEARTQGIDIVAVGSYYVQYPARLIVLEDSAINSVADLKGHSVGLPGRFGENWYALLIALDQAGLTDNEVEIAEIGYTAQVALTTGKVDAVVGFSNSDAVNFASANFPVKVIDLNTPLVSICLATTRSFADTNPEVVKTVISAMKKGMETATADTEGTLELAVDYIPSFRGETMDAARQVLPATAVLFADSEGRISPALDPQQWTDMAQAMGSVGLIPQGTDASAAFTNQFAG